MRRFKTDLILKYFKIIPLIIFIFSNSVAFGAVVTFVDELVIPDNSDGGQRQPTGVEFNPDGTKMYIIGISANKIRQFNLTTAFDVSSGGGGAAEATCDLTFAHHPAGADNQSDMMNLKFNSDGTKFFTLDTRHHVKTRERVDTYTLSTAYDISTCTFESTQEFGGGTERRAIDFSNDGKTIFIFDQTDNYSIKQYSLSSAFDLSNPTLVKNFDGINIKAIERFGQGLVFSANGLKMFTTGDGEDTVIQYSLSTPFDLRGKVTLDGELILPGLNKLGGINFNNDGSKMFVTDFGDRGIREYNLSCSFGVVKCHDPSTDVDDVSTTQSQTDGAKKLIKHSTSPVFNRMQWLRRNENRANLTNQNIKFQFNNEILNSLSKTLIPAFFSNDGSSKSNSENSNWSIWSEGTVSIGKTNETSYSSVKDVTTTAITLGADRRDENNVMRGIALRLGNDEVEIGNIGSALDMRAISLTFYGTDPKGDNKFADSLIGVSYLDSEIVNSDGSGNVTGERKGMQLYGSYNFRDTYNYDILNYTPKIKFDLGGTYLERYSEKGTSNNTFKYHEQFIGHLMTTVGTSLDQSYDLNNKTFIPYLNLDYTADISPSTSQKFTHISSGENFKLENINNSTHNFHGGIGFDLLTDKGLNLMTKYTIDQSEDGNKKNFIISADYRASYNSSYALSVHETSTEISYKSKRDNLNFDVTSNLDFFAEEPEYGIYLKVYTLK